MSMTEVNRNEFERVGEVEVDSRRRVSLARVLELDEHTRYFVSKSALGDILLVPAKSIPAREALVWENPELMASLRTAMEEASRGELEDRGDFSQYADDDIED